MQYLNKKEDLMQLYKLRLNSFKELSEGYVLDSIKLLEVDAAMNLYQNPEESPFFSDIYNAVETLSKNEKTNYLCVKLAQSLLNLKMLEGGWMLKCLKNYDLQQPDQSFHYQYFHCHMEYCYQVQDLDGCIDQATFASEYFDLFDPDESDFCPGIWCPLERIADANLGLDNILEAKDSYQAALEAASLTEEQSIHFQIIDKLSKIYLQHLDPEQGVKICKIACQSIQDMSKEEQSRLNFDPYLRLAECLKKCKAFNDAKATLKKSFTVSQSYKDVFNYLCDFALGKDLKVYYALKFRDIDDLVNVLNDEKLKMATEDVMFFLTLVVPEILKQLDKKRDKAKIKQLKRLCKSVKMSLFVLEKGELESLQFHFPSPETPGSIISIIAGAAESTSK